MSYVPEASAPPVVEPSPAKPVYQAQIDGLRAIAIMAVLLHHFGVEIPDFLEYGPISVRLFFALTGYFMTVWLWKAMEAAERSNVSLWRELPVFHARRLLRLCPPLYLALAVGWIMGIPEIRNDLLWHLGFATNFYVVKTGYWPLAVSHLWSLSVQEQFYLLWPVLILLVPRRMFLWVLVVVSGLALGYRLACLWWGVNPVVRWTMLIGSLDSFAVGAAVAWLANGRIGVRLMSERQKILLGLGAFGCLLMARWMRYWPQDDPWIAFIEVFEAVFIGWVLAATAQGWVGWFGRLLASPPLVYLGRISLGIYLYHVLVHIFFGPYLDGLGFTLHDAGILRPFLLVVLTVAVAAVSWHLFEQPLSRFKPAIVGSDSRRGR